MSITLITGTSTGIGQATALHLARQGHHVFASMRDPATSSAVLTEAARQEGLKLEVIQLDVNDPQSSERANLSFSAQLEELKVKVGPAFERAGSSHRPDSGLC